MHVLFHRLKLHLSDYLLLLVFAQCFIFIVVIFTGVASSVPPYSTATTSIISSSTFQFSHRIISMENNPNNSNSNAKMNKSKNKNNPLVVVATRLHLGNAAAPPDADKLEETISGFARFCASLSSSEENDSGKTTRCQAVIAVDATPQIEGYDYVQAVEAVCQKATEFPILVLPVTPWGKFVPALNALVSYATKEIQAPYILFVSAETKAPKETIQSLVQEIEHDKDTLVVGALLSGHTYDPTTLLVALNGRTSPWNTLAIWNLSKLALTGFHLVSDGLLTDDESEPSFGVEEVMAIAVLQKLLGADHAKAKLLKLDGVHWESHFDGDPQRQQWHEQKMNSKVERAERQLQLLGLSGVVHHL